MKFDFIKVPYPKNTPLHMFGAAVSFHTPWPQGGKAIEFLFGFWRWEFSAVLHWGA